MSDTQRPGIEDVLEAAGVPTELEREYLSVAELPPPEPMTETLERLASLSADTVLVQENDREPQFLYPKLADRGYEWETMELDDGTVITAIWEGD